MIKEVCIISDVHDWHSNQICQCLKSQNIRVKKSNFSDFFVKITNKNISFFYLKEIFKSQSVWVRFIDGGTIEEITHKLSILHLMKALGVYVHNNASIIEKTVDKFMCSALFSINKILTPKTFVFSSQKKFREIIFKQLELGPLLLKPIFGSQGKGIYIIKNKEDLESKIKFQKIFYLQEFIGDIENKKFSDIRVMVSNHKVVYAVKRTSQRFITNAFLGADLKKITISKELNNISKKISKIFNLGYGGLDFILFKEKYYLLEVNSIPSWKSSQKVLTNSITETLVNDFLRLSNLNLSNE